MCLRSPSEFWSSFRLSQGSSNFMCCLSILYFFSISSWTYITSDKYIWSPDNVHIFGSTLPSPLLDDIPVPHHQTRAATLWNERTRCRETCRSAGAVPSSGALESRWQFLVTVTRGGKKTLHETWYTIHEELYRQESKARKLSKGPWKDMTMFSRASESTRF